VSPDNSSRRTRAAQLKRWRASLGGLAGGAFAYLMIALKSERSVFWSRGSVVRSFYWWSFAATILLVLSAIDFLATNYRPRMATVAVFVSGYAGVALAGTVHASVSVILLRMITTRRACRPRSVGERYECRRTGVCRRSCML
jgi:hypothetical protein